MNPITHLPVNCWYAVAPVVTLTEEPVLVPLPAKTTSCSGTEMASPCASVIAVPTAGHHYP